MRKRLIISILGLFLILTPVFASAPAEVINPPPGSVIYTLEPFIEFNPDPLAQGYKCQIAEDPSYSDLTFEFTQVLPPGVTNAVGETTFSNITAGTPYMMRCEADHGSGYSGIYGSDWDFILAEAMEQKCQPSSEGVNTAQPILYFSVYSGAYGDTPINRTIFTTQTDLDFKVHKDESYAASVPATLSRTYNDTVFTVTDSNVISYSAYPTLNEYEYISPIDTEKHRECYIHGSHFTCVGNTIYQANLSFEINDVPNLDECEFNYTYAVNLQPNEDETNGMNAAAQLIALTAIFVTFMWYFNRDGIRS